MKLTLLAIAVVNVFFNVNHIITQLNVDDLDEVYETIPCLLKLCGKYFKSKPVLAGSLVVLNLPPDPTVFQSKIVQALNEDELHEIGLMIKDAKKPHRDSTHVTEKAKNYLMLIDDSSELEATIHQLKVLPSWNPLAKVVVLFTSEMNDFMHELEVKNVLIELFEYSVLDVNVMSHRFNTNIIQTQTWFPYEGSNCADTILNLRLIDECEFVEVDNPLLGADEVDENAEDEYGAEGDKKDSDENFRQYIMRESHYFSDFGAKSPRNYHGCPLRVSTSIWEPYVFGTADKIQKGLEVRMIEAITSRLNLVPIYKVMSAEFPHLRVTNNNKTGFYGDLMQGKTDIMIGGLYENQISRAFLSVSIPYYQDDLTWCVPKAKLAPTWMNAFSVFSVTIWMTVISSLLVNAMILFFFARVENTYKDNVVWAVLQTFCLTWGVSAHYWPRKLYGRIFIAGLFVHGIHFNAAYNSFLISVLTRPKYQTQISTVEKAIAEEFQFFGGENVLSRLKQNNKASEYIEIAYEICKLPDDCLALIKNHENMAVAISREHSQNSPSISKTELFCFSKTNNIYTYSVSMFVKKDYHLLPKINDIIRRICESGLLTVWLEASRTTNTATGQQGASGALPVSLSLDHVLGGFVLWAIGLSCATLGFASEWLVSWISRKRKDAIIQKYIENIFCYNSH